MCQGKKSCGERREGERRIIERSCSICEHQEVREKTVHLRNWKYCHSACPNYSHFWTRNSLKPVSLRILVPLPTPGFLTTSLQNSVQQAWTLENLSLLPPDYLSSLSLRDALFLILILFFFLGLLPIFDQLLSFLWCEQNRNSA